MSHSLRWARRSWSSQVPLLVLVSTPPSPEALEVVERLEAMTTMGPEDRVRVAERIEAFTDRRVGRYWTLVGIVNGWSPDQAPEDVTGAWEWYGCALRSHA